MYKWIITSVTFFALLLGVFYTPYYASAVSEFDNSYQNVNTIEVEMLPPSGETCSSIDLITTWSLKVIDSTRHGTYASSFQTATTGDGRWGVTQEYSSSGTMTTVFWTEDDSLYLEWWSGGVQAKGNSLKIATLWNGSSFGSSCEDVQIYDASSVSEYVISYTDGTRKNSFVYTDNPNIPEDYEGVIPPDTISPPTPPLDWKPDIQHVQSIDWKILLQDRNFNTFDPVPFTCNQGLTPVIQYDLLNDDTNENLDQGVMSPTIQYQFQAEDYGVETTFKFIANYYCGDLEDDPTFSGQTTYYFTLNASGTFVPDTPSCFSDTFPYIDIDGCTSVIEDLINNLSFGTINFPEWEINSDGCHTLGILGDWINVPSSSRTICPQFSPTVRNVVTPFLTFVLGITIIGVLVTKSRNDFN